MIAILTKFTKRPEHQCKDIALMLPLYVMKGAGLTADEMIAVENHLANCQRCRREYDETQRKISFINRHRDELIRRGAFDTPVPETADMNVSAYEFTRFSNKLRYRHENRKWLRASSAIAACLVVGVFTWLVFSIFSKTHIVPQPSSQQEVFVLKTSVKIELITNAGNTLVPNGQQITTGTNEIKTLIINGNRQMMLNQNTKLVIESLTQNGMIGCVAKLDVGEIYTHVEHDGKPFVVHTQHGQAVITGTTFDLKADDTTSMLVVSEGTVLFGSDNGTVQVLTNQQSTMVTNLPPTVPVVCDAAQLTAWVNTSNTSPHVTSLADEAIFTDLLLNGPPEPIDLEKIDYVQWVEENRTWFKKEFPSVFELKDALLKEGITVDYPELLIQTGDVWQFAYPEHSDGRIALLNPASLVSTAAKYSFDEKWVQSKLYLTEQTSISNTLSSVKALERWLEIIRTQKKLALPVNALVYC